MLAFGRRVDASLAGLVESLRTGSPPQIVSLREAERELAAHLDTAAKDDEARVIADAVAQALDRITDSIDTLAYLLRPAERPAA